MIVHINACHIPFFLFIGCSTFAFLKMHNIYFLFQSSPWVSGPVVVERSEIQSLLLLLISQMTQEPVTTEPQTKGRAKENLPSSGLNPKITQKETPRTYLPLVNLLTYPQMHNLLNHKLLKHKIWMNCYHTTNTPRKSASLKNTGSYGTWQAASVSLDPCQS